MFRLMERGQGPQEPKHLYTSDDNYDIEEHHRQSRSGVMYATATYEPTTKIFFVKIKRA